MQSACLNNFNNKAGKAMDDAERAQDRQYKNACDALTAGTKDAISDMLSSITARYGAVPALATANLGTVVNALAAGMVSMSDELPPVIRRAVISQIDRAEEAAKELLILAVHQHINEKDRTNFLESVAAVIRRPLNDAMKLVKGR